MLAPTMQQKQASSKTDDACKFLIIKDYLDYLFKASLTATAQATVIPTIGLLPNPVIAVILSFLPF